MGQSHLRKLSILVQNPIQSHALIEGIFVHPFEEDNFTINVLKKDLQPTSKLYLLQKNTLSIDRTIPTLYDSIEDLHTQVELHNSKLQKPTTSKQPSTSQNPIEPKKEIITVE